MGAAYGAGLLGVVPRGIETEKARLACVTKFAESGISHKFQEAIGGRVVEFTYKNGKVTRRTLSVKEAQPVLAAYKLVGGSAPYSLMSRLEFPILCP